MTNHGPPFNVHQDSPELSSVADKSCSSQDKQADDNDSGSNTHVCTPSQHGEEVKVVDLKLCSNVQYDKRDGVHGVTYRTEAGNDGWTPVRRKLS